MTLRSLASTLLAVLTLGIGVLSASAQTPPPYVPVQGYLADAAGVPVDGRVAMRFRLYDSPKARTAIFEETQPSVRVEAGYFSVSLGDTVPLDLSLFAAHPALFVGILVGDDEEELSPRLQLATAPYAGFSQACGDAATLGGITPAELRAETNANIAAACYDSEAELTSVLDDKYLSSAGGRVSGPVSAPAYTFSTPRTEFFTVAGLVFVDMDQAAMLITHDISGSMFFKENAPAGAVIYSVAAVNIPHGSIITAASCSFRRATTDDSAAFGLWRSNGDGTATSLSYLAFPAASTSTGASVPLTATIASERVELPTRSYYLSVRLTNSQAGNSRDRLALNSCYVTYSRQAL